MGRVGRVVQSAAFVTGDRGPRFRLVTEPSDGTARGNVLFVHAFAEEMNKSRRMAARLARLLAADGWRVVQRDLYGCGDSAGDFGDATWAHWARDVEDEFAALDLQGPTWLWCHRAGALLASVALARCPSLNLLLWQPVASGAQHLQQFLRLHAGARIVGAAGASALPSPLQMLRAGQAVEVGGYRLHPQLAAGLEQASFTLPPAACGRIVWLEVSGDEVPTLTPQALRQVNALRERGVVVQAEALAGVPFWQTQEIEECEPLLERSRALLAEVPADAHAAPVARRAEVAP